MMWSVPYGVSEQGMLAAIRCRFSRRAFLTGDLNKGAGAIEGGWCLWGYPNSPNS
jgi:hypothetical protein